MYTYTIEITETLQKQLNIEAESYYEAVSKVEEMYNNNKIELNSEDVVETTFLEPVGCAIARQMCK